MGLGYLVLLAGMYVHFKASSIICLSYLSSLLIRFDYATIDVWIGGVGGDRDDGLRLAEIDRS